MARWLTKRTLAECPDTPTVFGHPFYRQGDWWYRAPVPESPNCRRCGRHILDHERLGSQDWQTRSLLCRERARSVYTPRRPNRRDRRGPTKPGRR